MARGTIELDLWKRRGPRWFLGALAAGLLATSRDAAAGALEVVVQQTARSLGQVPASSIVVAAPLASDEPAPRGEELALRVASLVAGAIGTGARTHPQVTQLGPARAIAGHASALIYVQTEIAKGDVRATIDAYAPMANAWDRIRNPLPAPILHAFATTKVDAEVRSFLTPLVLELATVHKAQLDEPHVLAAACGDADEDGGNEIVLVSRDRVVRGRVRAGRFAAERTAAWSDLLARSPVPMREPLASAVVAGGTVAVGSTDRGSLTLTPDLTDRSPLPGLPAWGLDGMTCLTTDPSTGVFSGSMVGCSAAKAPGRALATPAPRFDAFAADVVPDARGGARSVVAVREPSGKLRVQIGDAAPLSLETTVGAQIAVGDLDLDGAPEIAASAEAAEDSLDVWSLLPDNANLVPRLHLTAPGGVRALAMCPPEEHGQPVLVAVIGQELWLVRAGVRGHP